LFLRPCEVQIPGLYGIPLEEPIDDLGRINALLELVLFGEEEALGGLDGRVVEKGVPVVGLFGRRFELRGGYAALLFDLLRSSPGFSWYSPGFISVSPPQMRAPSLKRVGLLITPASLSLSATLESVSPFSTTTVTGVSATSSPPPNATFASR